MLIVEWTPVTETEIIPPLGDELISHLEQYHGAVKFDSCSAWSLLYKALRKNNLTISTVAFTENGKPCFTDPSLHFSISHSHGLCAVAVADRPVGVDIEICKKSYKPNLIERSLCDAEKQVFDGDFTRIWCRKEAMAKMTGEGITGYPFDIDTTKYEFQEKLINYDGKNYWLVAVKR